MKIAKNNQNILWKGSLVTVCDMENTEFAITTPREILSQKKIPLPLPKNNFKNKIPCTIYLIIFCLLRFVFSHYKRYFSGLKHRGSQHSFLQGSVRTFDLFAAEAKQAGFNIIICVLWPNCQEKIIASLNIFLTFPQRKECYESLWQVGLMVGNVLHYTVLPDEIFRINNARKLQEIAIALQCHN